MSLTRQEFLKGFAATLTTGVLSPFALASELEQGQTPPAPATGITLDDLKAASKVVGVAFSEAELRAILRQVNESAKDSLAIRKLADDWQIPPASAPTVHARRLDPQSGIGPVRVNLRRAPLTRPRTDEDLAFLSVAQLGELLRSRQVTSTELTQLSRRRLKRYGPQLRCLVNLCEERALAEAKKADEEIAAGRYRGPLHGIPYGVKDLFATQGAKTTWGAAPFKDQEFDFDAAVVERLSKAGAVLVAKLSMGALAMGDVWFAGRTESPHDAKIGASGSSAGSASATAAGLVPFAIGTETSGSIVSPSHNCRVTGLRPTFGSISRRGAMPLCWSLDKVGPICRDADDCALVFAALVGYDPADPGSIARGFQYGRSRAVKDLRIGYYTSSPDAKIDEKNRPWLTTLREMGAKLQPMTLPTGEDGLYAILYAECGAAFDSFTTGPAIQDLKNSAWPATFRASRFLPAVDLVQAERARSRLGAEFHKELSRFDAVVVDDRAYPVVYQMNLTGEPQVLVPFGTTAQGAPQSFSLIGPAFSESTLLDIASQVQRFAKLLGKRPDLKPWG